MVRKSTSTFIATIPLVVTSKDNAELTARFNAGLRFYNAMLNEAMARLELVRNCSAYKRASVISKDKKKERAAAFASARSQYRYSEYDLQAYGTIVARNSKWLAHKVDANTLQKLATRALRASERVLFGQAKKVRYKGSNRFRSMEGKTNKQGIRRVDNQLVWGKLRLKAIIDQDNPVIAHALNSPIKYVRIIRKEVHRKQRWYCQLICEGTPYTNPKHTVGEGTVGLDLNISNVAYVADSDAGLLPFAAKVPTYQKQISRLERKMERSRRINHLDNYEPDVLGKKGRKTVLKKGQIKKGKKLEWDNSKTYKQVAAARRELERRKTEYAKSQNRRLVNAILRSGKHIKTEKVFVRGWQKIWGKAISAKSPGFFQSELKRKAESAGGSFYEFSAQKTALSQTHLTGERIKKSLSERVHYDKSGVVMQRDLMSAFLSRHVYDDLLLLQDAQSEYPRMETTLLRAWQQHRQQAANRVGESKVSAVIALLSRSVATQKSLAR